MKNLNCQKENSRLFTSVDEDLNSERLRPNPKSGLSGTRTLKSRIASAIAGPASWRGSITLPPNISS